MQSQQSPNKRDAFSFPPPFFRAREDFAQMSLQALVIAATAVEAHGPSF